MRNTLTLNAVTIDYPSHMTVVINGVTIRLSEPSQTAKPADVAAHVNNDEAPTVETFQPAAKVTTPHNQKPSEPRKKSPPHSGSSTTQSLSGHLPIHWKTTVIQTLKEHNGSCYARMLSLRVFDGMGKITYGRATKLRRALREMVERGELLALGTAGDRKSAQMLYGLPNMDDERVTARAS